MQEAFEQVIERQTCEQFEKWLENHEPEQKAAPFVKSKCTKKQKYFL